MTYPVLFLCSEIRFKYSMNHICECIKSISIKAVIRRDGKILAVLDDHGHWDLPGGRMMCKEDLWETLHRELREELGLENFTVNKQPYFVFSWNHPEKPLHGIIIGVEVSTSESDFVSQDPNIKQMQWLDPLEFLNLPIASLIKPYYLEIFKA